MKRKELTKAKISVVLNTIYCKNPTWAWKRDWKKDGPFGSGFDYNRHAGVTLEESRIIYCTRAAGGQDRDTEQKQLNRLQQEMKDKHDIVCSYEETPNGKPFLTCFRWWMV